MNAAVCGVQSRWRGGVHADSRLLCSALLCAVHQGHPQPARLPILRQPSPSPPPVPYFFHATLIQPPHVMPPVRRIRPTRTPPAPRPPNPKPGPRPTSPPTSEAPAEHHVTHRDPPPSPSSPAIEQLAATRHSWRAVGVRRRRHVCNECLIKRSFEARVRAHEHARTHERTAGVRRTGY